MHKTTILALTLTVATAACVRNTTNGGDVPTDPPDPAVAAVDLVDPVQGTGLVFHLITTDSDPAAARTQQGAHDAAAALGVDVAWRSIDENADAGALISALETAVADNSDGVAVGSSAVGLLDTAATSIDVPLVIVGPSTITNRLDAAQLTHVGPVELDVGRDAGIAFNDLGATKVLCTTPTPDLRRYEERCAGVRDTFNGEVVIRTVGNSAGDAEAAISTFLAEDDLLDGVLGLDPRVTAAAADACGSLERLCLVGGVGVSDDIAPRIENGTVGFAIDLRAYAQGYYAVAALYLDATQARQERSSLNTDTVVVSTPVDG